MKVVNILNEQTVRTNLQGTTKTEIIEAMIELAATQESKVVDKEKMKNAIFEREKVMSTGVGMGFAIPHGKTDAVLDIVGAFATTKEPIEFNSLDGEPVRLIFLLIGRESSVDTYIKLLSRISRMMNKEEFRNKLLEADSPKSIIQLFKQEESTYLDT